MTARKVNVAELRVKEDKETIDGEEERWRGTGREPSAKLSLPGLRCLPIRERVRRATYLPTLPRYLGTKVQIRIDLLPTY